MIQNTNSLEENSSNYLKVENWPSRSEATSNSLLIETRSSRNEQTINSNLLLADIIVRQYEGAHGFGHIGSAVVDSNIKSTEGIKTEGLYPKENSWKTLFGTVPGELRQDNAKIIKEVRIKTTPEQDRKYQEGLDQARENKINYNLYKIDSPNCVGLPEKNLKAIGVDVPDTMLPKKFINGLEKNEKSRQKLNDMFDKIGNTPPANNSSQQIRQGI